MDHLMSLVIRLYDYVSMFFCDVLTIILSTSQHLIVFFTIISRIYNNIHKK